MWVSKKVIHQILACFPVIINEFMTRISYGWIFIATVLKLRAEEQISWIISVSEVATILGSIVSIPLVDNLGRKNTLIMIPIMYFVVWVSTTFVRDIYLVYVVQIIFGLAIGINNVVSGIYTIENCSPHFRGIMGSIIMITVFGSEFIEYIVDNYYLSYEATAIASIILAGCVFATFYYGTETPYFLIMKGRREEAEKSLLWLSDSKNPDEVAEELKKIEDSIAEEKLKKRSLKLLFFSSANLKGIFVVVSMRVLLIASGHSVWSIIFPQSTVLTFMVLCVSPFIIEKVNRRSLVIGCSVAVTVCYTCSYLLMSFHNNEYTFLYHAWLIIARLTFNIFTALMIPAWYVLKEELLPFSVRAIGSSMAIIAFSMSSFIFRTTIRPIAASYGRETNLLIYSIMGLLMTVFVYFLLPETRGRPLHELHNSQKGEIIQLEEQSDTQLGRE